MYVRTGNHFLDRRRFITWLTLAGTLNAKLVEGAAESLITGGEHIVTAEDLLATCSVIPGHLIEHGTLISNRDVVSPSTITLIYKPISDDTKEDEIPIP